MKSCHAVIESESYGRDAFNTFLESVSLYKDIEWRSKPNGPYSPPDFYLTLDGDQYSIEVTETKVRQKDGLEQQKFQSSRMRLVEEINRIASELGILHGTYHASFQMNWISPFDGRVRKAVKEDILNYLRETQNRTDDIGKYIFFNSYKICQIFKTVGRSNKVHISFSGAAWTYSPENKDTVFSLLNDAVTIKAKKLSLVPQPRILLLINTFAFAEKSIYQAYINKIAGSSFFHTIFVIMGQIERNFVLCSRNERWLNEAGGHVAPSRDAPGSGNGPR